MPSENQEQSIDWKSKYETLEIKYNKLLKANEIYKNALSKIINNLKCASDIINASTTN